MEKFDAFVDKVKANIMRKTINFTDAQYYLLKYKPQLQADQKKFVDVYENVFIMQGFSLIAMIPSLIYMIRSHRYRNNLNKNIPAYTLQGHKKLFKKLLLYLSFGTILAVNSQAYSYMNNLPALFKQMGNREKAAFESGKIVQIQL